MTLESFLDTLAGYACDLKLNLSTLLRQAELTPQQAWGTSVASAIASRNPQSVRVLTVEAGKHISSEALSAAKAAAAIMGMNNIYHRFTHLVENPKYGTIPARLRMQIIRSISSCGAWRCQPSTDAALAWLRASTLCARRA